MTYLGLYYHNYTMSLNRVQFFIRSILQNSKLNRENFVNNKKKYNTIKHKHNKFIIKRNFSSSNRQIPPPNNNNNNNRDNFIFMSVMLSSAYIINKFR